MEHDLHGNHHLTLDYWRAASVSERSEANDRVLFEIFLYICPQVRGPHQALFF